APDPQCEHAPAGTAGGSGPCETRSVAARRMGAPAARLRFVRGTPDVSADPRRHSRVILDGPERAAARAYLKGIGYDDDALKRPIIGVANTWTETMPCNFHLRRLADRGKDVTIQDVFEAVGAHAAGDMSDADLNELEAAASPGSGACGGQYTANTMATAFEVLGISPMGSGMMPAEDGKKGQVAEDCGRLV